MSEYMEPLEEAVSRLEDVEIVLFSLPGPALIPARHKDLDEARNILKRLVKRLNHIKQMRDNDLECHRDEPWSDNIGRLLKPPVKDDNP